MAEHGRFMLEPTGRSQGMKNHKSPAIHKGKALYDYYGGDISQTDQG